MMRFVSAVMFACALAFAAPAASVAQSDARIYRGVHAQLSGDWRGVYFQEPDNQGIEFSATLTTRNTQLTGTTIEPNMFGDNSSFWLLANLAGRVDGDTVRFAKTYDGTGGQSHTVMYEGRVINGRRIVGTWSLAGASGQFEMGR